jgi:putative colanic acid biosynthesis acetyltransferase WcaF
MRLDQYSVGDYSPGVSLLKQLLWFFIGDPIVRSRLIPISVLKVWILRSFGAKIGIGIRIKPGVQIKFPWRLTIGDHCWIGENVWLDNVAPVILQNHICLSQGVYLCTGNHNWQDIAFCLMPAPIQIHSGSWIAAKAVIGPGVVVGEGAVLCLGSVANGSLEAMTIYAGNPSVPIKKRSILGTLDKEKSPSGLPYREYS